jgi:cell division GTPase FtsZ
MVSLIGKVAKELEKADSVIIGFEIQKNLPAEEVIKIATWLEEIAHRFHRFGLEVKVIGIKEFEEI